MPKIPPVYAEEVERIRAEAFHQGVDHATDRAIALFNAQVMPAAAAAVKKVRDAAFRAGAQAGADAALAATSASETIEYDAGNRIVRMTKSRAPLVKPPA